MITNIKEFPDIEWSEELKIIGYLDSRNIVELGKDGLDTIVGLTTEPEPSEETEYQAISLFELMNQCPDVNII